MVRTQGNDEIRLVLLKDVLVAEGEWIQVGGGQRGGREATEMGTQGNLDQEATERRKGRLERFRRWNLLTCYSR